MNAIDKLSARWRTRADRKMLREAASEPPVERIRRRLGRRRSASPTAPSGGTLNRAQRRQAMRGTGPALRGLRLQTHMRRPVMAMRCSEKLGKGKHAGVS